MTKIDVEGGKYTFVIGHHGEFFCLRYGEPWVDLASVPGVKALIALFCEYERLLQKSDNVNDKLFDSTFATALLENGMLKKTCQNQMCERRFLTRSPSDFCPPCRNAILLSESVKK